MSAAVIMLVHDLLLRLLLLPRNLESSRQRQAALHYHISGTLLLWLNMSQRGCIGESVTSAEDRCAHCMGEVYMQFKRERGNRAVSRMAERNGGGAAGREEDVRPFALIAAVWSRSCMKGRLGTVPSNDVERQGAPESRVIFTMIMELVLRDLVKIWTVRKSGKEF